VFTAIGSGQRVRAPFCLLRVDYIMATADLA
jgi:hypothetical protein